MSNNISTQNEVLDKLKLHTNFSSSDEKELELFLKDKICFSKEEKKYLVRYVVKGIPDHMRGKVMNNYI